jgi:hypothetical protein
LQAHATVAGQVEALFQFWHRQSSSKEDKENSTYEPPPGVSNSIKIQILFCFCFFPTKSADLKKLKSQCPESS